MTTTIDGFEAGVLAVIADNTLNRSGFSNAIRTVIDQQLTFPETQNWVDAIALEYNRLGIINNPTYNNLRTEIINEGAATAVELFTALSTSINSLVETEVVIRAARIIDLRTERDEIQTSIDRLNVLKDPETQQVKQAINLGIDNLRGYKQVIRDELQNLIGDPDG